MNVTYKHLEAKLRIGELTLGQWSALFAGIMAAILWSMYLHPFGAILTLITTAYVGGIPLGVVFLANVSDFDLWLIVRSAVRWRRADLRYMPGPGTPTSGYRLLAVADAAALDAATRAELDLSALWGER